jgi:hypothetical protein
MDWLIDDEGQPIEIMPLLDWDELLQNHDLANTDTPVKPGHTQRCNISLEVSELAVACASTKPDADHRTLTSKKSNLGQTSKRAKVIDREMWEKHRDTIKSLYATQSLDQILKSLLEEHKFPVTKKQLNTKIAEWKDEGFLPSKNVSKVDMDYMVRIQHQQESSGVRIRFKHRGTVVDDKKLAKHRKRFGIQHEQDESKSKLQGYYL